MDLYLLRHGISADVGRLASDQDRPLSDEGRERLRRATASWEVLRVAVDGILTSPHARARETADIAARALGVVDHVEVCPALASGASPADIIGVIAERCGEDHRVMIVGHEPDLGRVISMLLCGDDEAVFRIKQGGLTKLTVDSLHVGRCAALEWQVWPRHMLRMK